MFQSIDRYFRKIGNSVHILVWISKGLSDECIKHPATSHNSLAPSLSYICIRPSITFDGQCLKQDSHIY